MPEEPHQHLASKSIRQMAAILTGAPFRADFEAFSCFWILCCLACEFYQFCIFFVLFLQSLFSCLDIFRMLFYFGSIVLHFFYKKASKTFVSHLVKHDLSKIKIMLYETKQDIGTDIRIEQLYRNKKK